MPYKCCVPKCRGNYDKKEKVSVFKLPVDEDGRRLWLSKIPRDNFQPRSKTVVCERHFDQSFIVRIDSATRPDGSILSVKRDKPKLTSDAYPSIFPYCPSYLSSEIPGKRKTPGDRRKRMLRRHDDSFAERLKADKINNFDQFYNDGCAPRPRPAIVSCLASAATTDTPRSSAKTTLIYYDDSNEGTLEDESMDVFCESVDTTSEVEEAGLDLNSSNVGVTSRYSHDGANEGENGVGMSFVNTMTSGDIGMNENYAERESEGEFAELIESSHPSEEDRHCGFGDDVDPTQVLQKFLEDSRSIYPTIRDIKQEPIEKGIEGEEEFEGRQPGGLASYGSHSPMHVGAGSLKTSLKSATKGTRLGSASLKKKRQVTTLTSRDGIQSPGRSELCQADRPDQTVLTYKALNNSSTVELQRLSPRQLAAHGIKIEPSTEAEHTKFTPAAISPRRGPGRPRKGERINTSPKATNPPKRPAPPVKKVEKKKARVVHLSPKPTDKRQEKTPKKLGKKVTRKGNKIVTKLIAKNITKTIIYSSSDDDDSTYSLPAVNSGLKAVTNSQPSTRRKSKKSVSGVDTNFDFRKHQQQQEEPANPQNTTKYTEILESIKVYVFTCGHACGACNSTASKEWLKQSGFHTARPIPSIVKYSNRVAAPRKRKIRTPVVNAPALVQTSEASQNLSSQSTKAAGGVQAADPKTFPSTSSIPPNVMQKLIKGGLFQDKVIKSAPASTDGDQNLSPSSTVFTVNGENTLSSATTNPPNILPTSMTKANSSKDHACDQNRSPSTIASSPRVSTVENNSNPFVTEIN